MTSHRHAAALCTLVCACFNPTGVTKTEVSDSLVTESTSSTESTPSTGSTSSTGPTLISTSDDSTATDLFCGDGILSAGEECDDGGQSAGDGCSPECFKEFRRVFVTSEQFSGNMGGVSGAHALCQAAAAGAGLMGTFSAWLSDSTHSPEKDFVKSKVPYRLVDGTVVSDNWEQLISGQLKAGISLTEEGGAPLTTSDPCIPEDLTRVWTNTKENGNQTADHLSCDHWAAGGDQGNVGVAGAVNQSWSQACYMPCTTMAPLYCFEQ